VNDAQHIETQGEITALATLPRTAPLRHGEMTRPKTWDLGSSLEADWPPHQTITLTDLVAEARAVDWDFTNWCYASGYDASDPDARRVFECLLAYAMREGCAGLH
jgi:hypothetical protein